MANSATEASGTAWGNVLDEGISPSFGADCGVGAVAGVDDGVVRERHQFGVNRGDERPFGAAGEIRSSDASGEEGIPGEKNFVHEQADPAGGVAWGVQDLKASRADRDQVSIPKDSIRGWAEFAHETGESGEVLIRIGERIGVEFVSHNGNVELFLERNVPADVIGMGVGDYDPLHRESVLSDGLRDL